MFDLLKESIGKDGVGRMSAWVSFTLDIHKLACGNSMHLENNYKNNSYVIKKLTYRGGVPIDIKKITSGKDETLSNFEFRKWLISSGYKDSFTDYENSHKAISWRKNKC